MPFDPLTVVVEILGEPAASMRNPANAGYNCPFINSECIKRSHRFSGPYPVCTIRGGPRHPGEICVCPMRFFEIDLANDIIQHCWIGEKPEIPRIAHEVAMPGFGMVDFVLADIDSETIAVKNCRTRMVAVIQTTLYNHIRQYIHFDELPATGSSSNIVFLLYRYEPAPEKSEDAFKLVLDHAVGTSHSSLMTGSLYRSVPDRQEFCDKIIANLQ